MLFAVLIVHFSIYLKEMLYEVCSYLLCQLYKIALITELSVAGFCAVLPMCDCVFTAICLVCIFCMFVCIIFLFTVRALLHFESVLHVHVL